MSMLMGMGMPGLGNIPQADATITFTDSVVDAVDRTTYTFTTRAIGTAANTRRVIVFVGQSTSTIASATIGGITATLDVNNSGSGFISAIVPTGTTATIVVTLNAGVVRCGIAVWAAYGLVNSSATAVTSVTTNSATLDLQTLQGSIVVAGMYLANGTVPTNTWTNLTENLDITFVEGTNYYSVASRAAAPEANPGAYSSTISGASAIRTTSMSYR